MPERTPEQTLSDIQKYGFSGAAKRWKAQQSQTNKPLAQPVQSRMDDGEYELRIAKLAAAERVKAGLIARQNAKPENEPNVFRQLIAENFHVVAGKHNPLAVAKQLERLQAQAVVEDERLRKEAQINTSLEAIENDEAVIEIRERAKVVYETVATNYADDKFAVGASEAILDLAAAGRVVDAQAALEVLNQHVIERETEYQAKIVAAQAPQLESFEASKKRLAALQGVSAPVVAETPASATGEPAPSRARVYKWTPNGLQLESEPQIEGSNDAQSD